jgi:Zinc carboxypeptidase
VKVVLAAAAVCAALAVLPAAASADATVDAATAARKALNLGTLTAMPSGSTAYRTIEQFGSEMDALAAANPGFVAVKSAPYTTLEGRTAKYLEITNNVGAENDGKPVFFLMGAIHGNESAGGEDDLEFAYDVIAQSKSDPALKALFDHVRLIDMPVVNPDGWAHNRRTSNNGTDLNRNYPFGWGSNINGLTFTQRGPGPGSEPEVRNTMWIVQNHQVVDLVTTHTNERAIFYPELDVFAGDTPELNTGYKALAQGLGEATNNGYTNIRDSAHDYETAGETIDWSYYATRGFALTMELVGPVQGCPQARPNYLNCTMADYTGSPPAAASTAQKTTFTGHAVRDAFYEALVWASLPAGHSLITGTAPAGATLKLTKDFNLFTAPIKNDTTPPTTSPPQAIPTHLESSLTVPANGRFNWDVNPSIRPTPAFRADGEVSGPNGFLNESYTVTCTAADGTLLETNDITVDRGQTVNMSLCTQGSVGGTVPATLALTLGPAASFGPFTAGVARTYTASTTATVTSTAGDALLSVADPSPNATGHLVNGTYSLLQPLTIGGSALPAVAKSYSGPVSNDPATVTFTQAIGANEALRTGTYAKTLTYTLSTTSP